MYRTCNPRGGKTSLYKASELETSTYVHVLMFEAILHHMAVVMLQVVMYAKSFC